MPADGAAGGSLFPITGINHGLGGTVRGRPELPSIVPEIDCICIGIGGTEVVCAHEQNFVFVPRNFRLEPFL